MHIEVDPEFGFIILVLVASVFLLQGLGINVGRARKKYGVKYPAMYSDREPIFNCIQRAHQNTLEAYPVFVILLVIGGLQYPTLCAGCGCLWLISRIFYAKGYYTGEPGKRQWGSFGYIGMLVLLFSTIRFAVGLLGWY